MNELSSDITDIINDSIIGSKFLVSNINIYVVTFNGQTIGAFPNKEDADKFAAFMNKE